VAAEPELVVSKDDGRAAVSIGQEYSYAVTVFSRLVAETIDDVTLTDTLPSGLEYVSANPAPASVTGQTLTWNIGTLEQAGVAGEGGDLTSGGEGSSVTLTVTVRVAAGTMDSVTNSADAVGTDPATAATLTAHAADQDAVNNVFTDLAAEVDTPQNVSVETALEDIVTASGAALDPATVTQATAPSHGSLSIDPATGAVTYEPETGYSGDDSYVVEVCDTSATPQCSLATVTVHVGVNTVDAVDDSDTTTAGAAVTTDVWGNDLTASGQPFALPTIARQPANGSVSVAADGQIVYTPDPGTSGTDSYDYRLCDTSHPAPVCDTATVTLSVANVFTDGPAAAANLGVETAHNAPVTTPLADIVTVAGAPIDLASIAVQTAPANGTIGIDPTTGAVTYTPNPGYAGADAYALHVCDTSAPTPQCHDVTVAVEVLANAVAAPDLTLDTLTDQEAEPLDVIAAAISSSEQPLQASPTIVTDPAHGTVTVNADGTITYDPEDGYDGVDSFAYEVCDTSHPTPVCDTGVVQVTVAPVADLVVTKTVDDAEVIVGDTARFTLTVRNDGPSSSEVLVEDTPVGMRVVAVTASHGTFDGTTWTIGTLASGEEATLTASYEVTFTVASNSASATGSAFDPAVANDSATVALRVSPRPTGGLASTGMSIDPVWPSLVLLFLGGGILLATARRRDGDRPARR